MLTPAQARNGNAPSRKTTGKPAATIWESWVFTVSRLLGLWPYDSVGRFRKPAFFRCLVSVGLPVLIFSWTRTASFVRNLKSTKPDAGITLTQQTLGFFIQLFMVLSLAAQVHAVYHKRNAIQSITRCLADVKMATQPFDVIFLAVLSFQSISCYLAAVSFSTVTFIPIVGSVNLILLATMNYIVILQFCAITAGLEKMLRLETASLKRLILLDRQAALLEMCRTTNATYHKQILLTLTQIFGYLVTYFYNLVMAFVQNDNFVEYVMFLFINVAVRFCMLMLIAYRSERLKIEAAAFNAELFMLVRDKLELTKNKKLTLFVMMKPSVNLTACGFFDLGYPLVTSVSGEILVPAGHVYTYVLRSVCNCLLTEIISAATTYLVILIQFSV